MSFSFKDSDDATMFSVFAEFCKYWRRWDGEMCELVFRDGQLQLKGNKMNGMIFLQLFWSI